MATIKSRFDATSSDTLQNADRPWLSTYSRGLCSIYPKDDDDCWDYLLSTQSSSIFSKLPDNPAPSSDSRNKSGVTIAAQTEKAARSTSTTPSLSSSFPGVSMLVDPNATNIHNSKGEGVVLAPLSPGSISHALCKIGFDCIDYFTATQDDAVPESPRPSSSPNNTSSNGPQYTSRMLEDLNEADWRTDLAAAVCGKRTAALERKRVLSRTMSQEDVVNATTTAANGDPWFETLDRLARWDEVAYR
ncbi:hypothetical protein EDD11_002514 [Mortierella claussenii]|nr:hypothetical protein EDD11_002514 [Mortierella claussenii]